MKDETIQAIPPLQQRMTLAQYVERRNGMPLGAPGSLRNMLAHSFGAGSFGRFWQYWNPIFGYGLGRFVYAPLRRILPASLALLMTFAVSGAIHDLVTSAVRGSAAFLFTPWFSLLGAGVIVERAVELDFSHRPFAIRAGLNLAYILVCLALTLLVRQALNIT